MLRTPSVSLPLPEPLALIDATLAVTVQLFISKHPELLLPPEVPVLRPPPSLRAARHIVATIRELHHAIDAYRTTLPDAFSLPSSDADPLGGDDIPF